MAAVTRRKLLAIGIAFGIGALLVASSLVLLPRTSEGSNCIPSPPPGLASDRVLVIAPCRSGVTLDPHSFTAFSIVRLSDAETVVGQYSTSSPAYISLGAYLLNSSEFGELLGQPHPTAPPPNFFWSSGAVPVCNLSVKVPGSPIQYYLVLENTGATEISLQWTQALVMYYSSTAPY